MSRRGVTLQDIAVRTGVSKVTVSYILNGRETKVRISDSTRTRVLAAAREMGYHPNALARALVRRCTDTVTLVMQFPGVFSGGTGFIFELLHGVTEAANRTGYDLMLHTKALPGVTEEVGALTDGRADGVLLLRDLGDPLIAELAARHFPAVCLFSRTDEPDACFVDCDNVSGGRLVAEHLLELGHRRLCFVGGSSSSSAVQDRWQGLFEVATPAGAEVTRCTVYHANGDFTPLREIMQRKDAPTAIFVWSDDVAVSTMNRLREWGFRVPEEVSVVGFDGLESLCERSVPRLTSVRQPIYEIAEQAMRLLVARIRQEEGIETQILLSPELIRRDSCAPVISSISSQHSTSYGRNQ
ncbi:MAG: LacI family DNA-binding transcriptional regulator [Capsulimonadales bacterium]|nr:LacI family DNA-binding transcriptional regulator [Capsulimonadales bacterium]